MSTKPARLSFPVTSFRRLDTPYANRKWGFAVLEVKDLPDLREWREINVRDPKLTGDVPRLIGNSFRGDPETFLFKNRGLTLSVKASEFDNATGRLTIFLEDPEIHGLLDGGHTNAVILNERAGLEGKQYVRIELLEGFDPGEVVDLIGARNTSNQVQDESLMNLKGKFDKLQGAFSGAVYASEIAYQEFELDAKGNPKPISVKEIIAILTAFNASRWTETEQPINAYRSRAACLGYFKEKPDQYEILYPIAKDILRLYDEVILALPRHYNLVGGKTGDGGSFGKLTGVVVQKARKEKLSYTGKESDYSVPTGFVFPMLAAFRALLEKDPKSGNWKWGMDPFMALEGSLGKALVKTIGDFALEMKNPSKQGKSIPVWQGCYQTAEIAYLRNKTGRPVVTTK